MNLTEAFRALDALNEDTFSVSDNGIQKLSEFEQNDDLIDDIEVIDPEADTEEDLNDSYIGKVILDCSVCHSKLYKDASEVNVDEEEQLANVGEECPYCYTSEGFKVIGEVSEFSWDDSSDEDDTEDVEEPADAEDSKIEEAFVSDDTSYYKKALKRSGLTKGSAQYERTKKDIKDLKKSVKRLNKETKKKGFDKEYGQYGQPEFLRDNPGFNRANNKIKDLDAKVRAGLDGKDTRNWGKNESIDESLNEGPAATLDRPMSKLSGTLGNVLTAHAAEVRNIRSKEDALALFDSIEEEVKDKEYFEDVKQDIASMSPFKVVEYLYNIILAGDGMRSSVRRHPLEDSLQESNRIDESVNNVNVETDDSIVNVSTDDNGKVTVTTEPNEASAEGGDEVIAPVSPETETEIMNNNSEESEEDLPAEDEELDLDVEEFDEESFDELGESYLRNIYENVESYKTIDVASSKNKIQVEGIIKFNSGNEKKTSFIFEAKDCNRKGKVRFIGENTQITRGKKAFTVSGSLNEGKFITESFRYNYKVKDDEGNSTRVYGTVKK